jgi:hypothetical protein
VAWTQGGRAGVGKLGCRDPEKRTGVWPGPHRRTLNEQNGIENGNQIDTTSVSTEEGLRVLARLIARRLQREALEREKNARQTIMLGAENAGQEARQ